MDRSDQPPEGSPGSSLATIPTARLRPLRGRTEETARRACVVCGHRAFEDLYSLDRFPAYMGTTDEPYGDDLFATMDWVACRRCETAQLARMPQVEAVYRRRHTEGLGKTWSAHEQCFRSFVERHAVPPIERVQRFAMTGPDLTAPSFSEPSEGTLVHSHTMEHWRRPQAVLENIAETLRVGSRMLFSVPAMDASLAKGVLAALNFEHTFHLSQSAIESLMGEAGFAIVASEAYADHSLFYACERTDSAHDLPTREKTSSARLVKDALAAQRADISGIEQAIVGFDGPVFLFGAHIFSQYLLNLGLNEQCFEAVLDNSRAKQGTRLYGTGLRVVHPTSVVAERPVLVVVRTGSYDTEIMGGLRAVLGQNVVFC